MNRRFDIGLEAKILKLLFQTQVLRLKNLVLKLPMHDQGNIEHAVISLIRKCYIKKTMKRGAAMLGVNKDMMLLLNTLNFIKRIKITMTKSEKQKKLYDLQHDFDIEMDKLLKDNQILSQKQLLPYLEKYAMILIERLKKRLPELSTEEIILIMSEVSEMINLQVLSEVYKASGDNTKK